MTIVPEVERRDCRLCGGEHEVIGTLGGVKIVTCERVADFGPNVGGVFVNLPDFDDRAGVAE